MSTAALRYDTVIGSRIDVKGLRVAIQQYKAELKRAMGDVKLIDADKMRTDVAAFRSQFRSSISGVVDDAKRVGTEYEKSTGKMRDANGRFVKGASADLDQAERKVRGFGAGIGKALQFVAINSAVQQISDTVSTLSKPFRELDSSLRDIGTLSVENFQEFKEVAIETSKVVPDSAAAVGTAIADAVGSGVIAVDEAGRANIAQGKEFVQEAANLALAGKAKIGESVGGISAVINSYGLAADQAGKVSDTFFNTFNLGVASVADLAKYMPEVTSLAAPLGISFDQLGASYATMTKQGNGVPQTTTKIKSFLTEIQKPGSALVPILEKAGVSLEKFKDGSLTLQSASVAIGEVLKKEGKEVTQVFGSVDAAGVVLALSGEKAAGAMADLEGIAQRGTVAAGVATQAASIENRMQIMINKVNARFIELFDTVGSGVTTALSTLASIAPQISALGTIQTLIPDGAIDATTEKLKGIGKSVADTSVIKMAGGKWQGFFNSLGKMRDRALSAGGKVVDLIPPSVVSKASALFGGITKLGGAFVGKMAVFGKAAATALLGPWGLAIAAVGLALTYFFTQTETGQAVFEKIKTYAVASFEFVKAIVLSAGSVIGKLFSGDFSGAIAEAKKGFGDAVNSFKDSVAKSGLDKAIEDATTIKQSIDKNDKLGELVTQFEGAQKKLQDAIASGADEAALTPLRANVEQFGAAIAQVMPQAVQEVKPLTDAQGRVTREFKINTQAVRDFANAQKKAYSGDLKQAQKGFVDGLKNQVDQYERNKKKLGELQVKITAAKPEEVGGLLKEFDELQAKVNENRDAIAGTFEEGKKLGLVGDDVSGIAKQFGLSAKNADDLQKTVNEVSQTTKQAARSADDLAAAFDGVLKSANENLTKTASAAAQLAAEGKKNTVEYKELVKSGIEERKNRDRLLKTQKEVNIALGIEKVEGKSAFERAKARYDLENDRLDVSVTQFEVEQETARIASRRERTAKDDLTHAQKKLDALKQQKKALEDNFKIDAEGNIGIRVTADEKAEVDKLVSGLNLELARQQNSVSDLVVKVGLDAEAIQKQFRDLRRANLEFEARVGIASIEPLVADLEEELQKVRVQMNVDPNLDEKSFLALSEKERQLEAQLSQIRQEARDKEFNEFRRQSDLLFDYEKQRIDRQSELQEKAVERQRRVFDLMLKSFDTGQQKVTTDARDRNLKAVDEEKDRRLKALQETEDAQVQSLQSLKLENSEKAETAIRKKYEAQRLAIEEESAQRREQLEAQYQAKVAANAALAKGVQLVTDREYEEKRLSMQLAALEQEKAALLQRAAINESFLRAQRTAAEQSGDLESVAKIDAALRDLSSAASDAAVKIGADMTRINEAIQENGDAGIIVTEQLADTLSDALGAFAAGSSEGIKEAFRNLFGVIAGALTRMASAAVLQVLFTPQAVAEYAALGFGAPAGFLALKLLLDGLVGKFLTPLVANMLAFPTGAVFDSPTLAVVGDGSRLGGENTEFLLRSDQLRENTKAALSDYDSQFRDDLRAIRLLLENLNLSVNLDMRRLLLELNTAKGAKSRRTF